MEEGKESRESTPPNLPHVRASRRWAVGPRPAWSGVVNEELDKKKYPLELSPYERLQTDHRHRGAFGSGEVNEVGAGGIMWGHAL